MATWCGSAPRSSGRPSVCRCTSDAGCSERTAHSEISIASISSSIVRSRQGLPLSNGEAIRMYSPPIAYICSFVDTVSRARGSIGHDVHGRKS